MGHELSYDHLCAICLTSGVVHNLQLVVTLQDNLDCAIIYLTLDVIHMLSNNMI